MQSVQQFANADFKKIVAALQERMLQPVIARAAGTSQPFISQIKSGKRKRVGFEIGFKLINLYAERVLGRKLVLKGRGRSRTR